MNGAEAQKKRSASTLVERTKYGYGQQILSQIDTVPGDLVVQDGTDLVNGMNHIGFCETAGCTEVLSNSGSTGELCGETNVTMSNSGYTYPADDTPTFYRLSK